MGTPGPVRARATPLQPRTGPIRACPWFAHSKVKCTLLSRPQGNPVRAPYGHAQLQPMVSHTSFAQYCPPEPRTGSVRACPDSAHGRPHQLCPVLPIWTPHGVCAGMPSFGPWYPMDPVRACPWCPWCPMVARTNWYNPSLTPYGVSTGLVWGAMGTVQPANQYGLPLISPYGPLAGLVWATKGHYGHARMGPTLSLVRAQSEPALGPVWALAGHTGHARAKPVWAPAGAAIWVSTIRTCIAWSYMLIAHILWWSAWDQRQNSPPYLLLFVLGSIVFIQTRRNGKNWHLSRSFAVVFADHAIYDYTVIAAKCLLWTALYRSCHTYAG